MAFLYDQRTRLLRESWTADALAQELYAMISADVASNTRAPVSISLPTADTVAPITIGNNTPTSPVFQINHPNGTTDTITLVNGQWFDSNSGNNQGPILMGGGGGGSGGGPVIPVWG